MLTTIDVPELTEFRRQLHMHPEVSGEEVQTAQKIADALATLQPNTILRGLGGNGVAAIFDTGVEGETVMFRAELDALPIHEVSQCEWKSKYAGTAHLCGHDGHMTILLALGRLLDRTPVRKGRVILLFQPAEEDGSGARKVISDPRYDQLAPDWAFAIHNLPGLPFGSVSTRVGLINCASQGLAIKLDGKTAHAASPEDGISPTQAIAMLVPALEKLGKGGRMDDTFALSTITHISVGEPSFGVSPGGATVFVTLRAAQDQSILAMVAKAKEYATEIAAASKLDVSFEDCDVFAASINNEDATQKSRNAMLKLQIPHSEAGVPMRASEDFGLFGRTSKSAMLCLGAGEDCPSLHNPDYDFPDGLIPIGASIFERIARDILG